MLRGVALVRAPTADICRRGTSIGTRRVGVSHCAGGAEAVPYGIDQALQENR